MSRPGKKLSADPARNRAPFITQSVEACVRSGHCCKQAPCPFGKWNADESQCAHLEGGGPGHYACGIYQEILGQPGADLVPAFGAGCCSPLNTDRRLVHLERHGEIRNEAWPR